MDESGQVTSSLTSDFVRAAKGIVEGAQPAGMNGIDREVQPHRIGDEEAGVPLMGVQVRVVGTGCRGWAIGFCY